MKTNFSGEYKVEKFCEGKDVTLFGAFPTGVSITFRVSLPRKYASLRSELILFSDFGEQGRYPLEWTAVDGANDVYEGTVSVSENGLYFYRIVFGIKWGERSVPNYRDGGDVFQLSFYDPENKPADWLKGGIMYQIFPDRFRNGKKIPVKKGSVLNEDWYNGIPQYAEKPGDPVANNVFFGGDLYGIAEKMDYIASLGVTVLYLNPIFDAASNHKYDIGDYMQIDSMFGGEEGFEKLLESAEKYGIRVILDGVFNHTGDDSKYFNRYGNYKTVGAYQSEKSKYKDWYNFTNYPDEYASWWGVKILPSTNKYNPEFREFVNGENGVIRHYLRKGISGWRLDVADELHDEFLKELHDAARAEKSDSLIIGEVWEDASNKVAYDKRRKYFTECELDSVMNYPFRDAVISYMLHGDAENIAAVTSRIYEHYPKYVSDSLMNIIGTHDTERILTVLGGQPAGARTNEQLSTAKMTAEERKNGIKLVKLAYLLISTLPGFPCIYYGDEIGMEGYRDPFNRLPYPWGREDEELLSWYRKIGELRKNRSEFKEGIYQVIYAKKGVFAFRRDSLVVIVNRSNSVVPYRPAVLLNESERLSSVCGPVTDILTGKTLSSVENLHPNSAAIIVIE
ncbi:MAG: glycoside hydrolase family 13 protein [Ruminococcaceae bacterium]|nr:glycoside hydrolase family 13 protein [Oscillospiraceae bacterium]